MLDASHDEDVRPPGHTTNDADRVLLSLDLEQFPTAT